MCFVTDEVYRLLTGEEDLEGFEEVMGVTGQLFEIWRGAMYALALTGLSHSPGITAAKL